MKTPVFAGGRTPVRPPPTHQSTPPGLTLSPLITIPWGLLGLGLGLAFQQIRPELGFEAGFARLGFGLCPDLSLGSSLMPLAPYRNSL